MAADGSVIRHSVGGTRPAGGQAQGLAFRHLDECEGLSCGDEESLVGLADHFEGADEADFGPFGEVAADGDPIAEAGGVAVVDFGTSEDGEGLGFGHGAEVHTEFCGEACAAGLDHAEVGEVVDDRAAVGVEEHDFFAGFDVVICFAHGVFLLMSGCDAMSRSGLAYVPHAE